MRGALVGYGTIAAGHHAAYEHVSGMDLVAVVDSNRARRARARARDPELAVYATLAQLLDSERLDFVDVCTPPSSHLEVVLESLGAGCHVLCEKPLVVEPGEFRALVEAVDRSTCCVYPSHNYKFAPVVRRLMSAVRSSAFGELQRGYFRTRRIGHARGVSEWKPDWRRMPEFSGGGIIHDHGTHSAYLACRLSGAPPEEVSCLAGRLRQDQFDATEDTALICLHFANGSEVRLDLTWASEVRDTSIALVGTGGNVFVDDDELTLTRGGAVTCDIVTSEFNDPNHSSWFVAMFEDFLDALGDREKQQALFTEAWTANAIVTAAYESARRGGESVPVPTQSAFTQSQPASTREL